MRCLVGCGCEPAGATSGWRPRKRLSEDFPDPRTLFYVFLRESIFYFSYADPRYGTLCTLSSLDDGPRLLWDTD